MGDQKLPGVFLPAKLGGWPINFLVDTGAQVSIVPKAVWLEITKGSAELRGFEGKVAAANGEEMEVIGRWQTTCQFDSLAVVAEFLVAEIPSQEVLLGTDFLARFGAVIDLGGKCCRLMGKKLPLLLPGDSKLPLLVTVHADTIVLSYPDPHNTFILDTDASNVGIGAVLSQEVDGLEQVIAYASRALTKQERKYATTKKELLGMVTFTKYFKHYLLGKEFILRTDHNSLRWLHNFKGLEGQLARWVEQLANFHYKIVHRPGKQHGNADALSRLPAFHEELVANPSPPVVAVVRQVGQLVEADWNIVDDLAQAQQEDAEIKLLIELKKRNGGSGAELQSNSAVRKYAPVWDQLQVQGQRLVRIPPVNSDAAHQVQVVLPKSLVPKVLAMLHSAKTGGHLGVQKLQGKVKDRFYWMGWFSDVKQWCRECVDCASRKTQGRAPRALLNPSVTARPYERIALDILGPLPETPRGNKYILVVGDYFSKWTEAFALPNQEGVSIARVVAEDPQSDGMIERFNRTLLSMLSLFVDDNQLNWDLLLPYVMMAYRSSIHASTGFTPYKVLFGQEIVLPVDVMLDVDHRETFASVSEYVAGLADTLSTVVGAVKRHQAKASGQQKTNFDFRANFQYYSVGELVWLRNKAKKRGVCPKLQRRYKGPFAILEQVSEVLYRIKQVEGGPETVVHFNRLKPFVPSTLVAGVPLPNAEEVSPVLGPGVSMGEEHRPGVPDRLGCSAQPTVRVRAERENQRSAGARSCGRIQAERQAPGRVYSQRGTPLWTAVTERNEEPAV
ncbi:hypothetical protein DPEC_G00098630 [Dallia pectoralis]|uniref:Uncharacterized protein n=1 Tax=Dallia pectoralis TaxID=75939 RepID=A0ACC2GWM6_DALPE|nr:hypothetical protein DPEC_G00098630 [Dallia pectoralis]